MTKCDQCGKPAMYVCDNCGYRLCKDCRKRAWQRAHKSGIMREKILCPSCGKFSTFTIRRG